MTSVGRSLSPWVIWARACSTVPTAFTVILNPGNSALKSIHFLLESVSGCFGGQHISGSGDVLDGSRDGLGNILADSPTTDFRGDAVSLDQYLGSGAPSWTVVDLMSQCVYWHVRCAN